MKSLVLTVVLLLTTSAWAEDILLSASQESAIQKLPLLIENSAWGLRVHLRQDKGRQSLLIVLNEKELRRFLPDSANEIYNTIQIVKLKNHKNPLLVTKWDFGAKNKVYVIDPELLRQNKKFILYKHLFDRLYEVEVKKDGSALEFIYGQDPGTDLPEAEKVFNRKTMTWSPG